MNLASTKARFLLLIVHMASGSSKGARSSCICIVEMNISVFIQTNLFQEYVPGTILGAWDINEQSKQKIRNPCPHRAYILGGEKT